MNYKSRALDKQELNLIIQTMKSGFIMSSGKRVKPNERAAFSLLTEANLGIRIGDVVRLKLSDVIFERDNYRLNIKEEKTGKTRNFYVPAEFYIFLQQYAIKHNIKENQRLFPITTRAVQNALKLTCDYLIYLYQHKIGRAILRVLFTFLNYYSYVTKLRFEKYFQKAHVTISAQYKDIFICCFFKHRKAINLVSNINGYQGMEELL